MNKRIYSLIRTMGVTSKYKGYHFLADAVAMTMEIIEKNEKAVKVTKDVYPILAAKYKLKTNNIEHDIRTVINVCWITNRKTVEKIAGIALESKPTNSEFIDMLAYYLEKTAA